MESINLIELTGSQALEHLKRGDVSAEAYIDALASQYAMYADDCAFTFVDVEGALEAARNVDKARAAGKPVGPLAGLPFVAKDNINSIALPTSGGTPALRDSRPGSNAPVLQALVDAGAILFGKGNMHELSFGVTSQNVEFGKVLNPFDRTRIVGGSSGGPAAAIARRIVPVGLGTDTGGSVRIPASLCGVAGFRPSANGSQRRYSDVGVLPLSSTRDTIGTLARSVADLVLLDSVVTGQVGVRAISLQGIRLGIARTHFWESLDKETERIVGQAVRRLVDAGAIVIEVDDIGIDDELAHASKDLVLYESLRGIKDYLAASNLHVTLEDIEERIGSDDVRALFSKARDVELPVYREALSGRRERLRESYARTFNAYSLDALVFPTTPVPAVTHASQNRQLTDTVQIESVEFNTFATYTRNTDPGSFAGLPGITLPVGLTSLGLPIGLALDAPEGDDDWLLSIALSIESVVGLYSSPRP